MTKEMKNLGNLSPARGSNTKKKRLGRGTGSGLGKTAGKGHKGQKARKGHKAHGARPGFEGGQTPLYRRLPKFGFTPLKRREFFIVNLNDLEKVKDRDVINPEVLFQTGLIRKPDGKVKILGDGSFGLKLKICAHKFSKKARELIIKAGGTVEEL